MAPKKTVRTLDAMPDALEFRDGMHVLTLIEVPPVSDQRVWGELA